MAEGIYFCSNSADMLKLSFDCTAANLPDVPEANESLKDLLVGFKMIPARDGMALYNALQVPLVSQYLEEFLLEDLPDSFTPESFIRLGAGPARVVLIIGDRLTRELELSIYDTRDEFASDLPKLHLAAPGHSDMFLAVLSASQPPHK